MININASVIGHSLILNNMSHNSLPTGSIGVDQIALTFSGSEWTSASAKYAVFWQQPEAVYKAEISNNTAVIPAEVLTERGIVHVAVYGDLSGDARISTNEVTFEAEQGALTAETAPAPTPSMFEQAVDAAIGEITEATYGAATNRYYSIDLYPDGPLTAWNPGTISASTGNNLDSGANATNYVRCNRRNPGRRCHLSLLGGYDIRVYYYTSSAYTGTATDWTDGAVGIDLDPATDPGTYYRYSVAKRPRGVLSDAEKAYITANFKAYTATDITLTENGYPADAKAVGERVNSLDEVAWGGKSFRDIFSKGDLLKGQGQFEKGNLDYWSPQTGAEPTIVAEGAGHVLDCISSGSRCSVTSPTKTLTNKPYMFLAARVKVLDATTPATGYGIASRNYSGNYGVLGVVTAVTDGYVTVGGRYQPSTNSSDDFIYVGNMGSANAGHCMIDNIVWINLTSVFGSGNEPSETRMMGLYERYIKYLDRHKPGGGAGLSAEAKTALLALLRDVAYSTPSAESHYNALVNALEL